MAKKTGIVEQRKTAAELLGVTARQLGRWANADWFPANARTPAGWNVPVIQAARDQQDLKGSETSTAVRKIRLDREAEKLRQDKIKTQNDQLRLQTAQGELLPRRAEELFASVLLTDLGDWCDQLPAVMEGVLPEKIRKKYSARLREELNTRRHQLHDELISRAKLLDAQEETRLA